MRSARAAPNSCAAWRAWQQLPPERLAAIEMMDVHGDAGRRHRLLRLRARRTCARLDRREPRALRRARGRGTHLRLGRSARAVHANRHRMAVATARRLRLPTAAGCRRASSSAPTVCVRGFASEAGIGAEPRPYEQTAVVANFTCRARASRAGVPMVRRRPGRAGMVAAAGPADLDCVVRARRACPGAPRVGCGCAGAAGRRGGRTRAGGVDADHAAGRVSAVVSETRLDGRAQARVGRRCRPRRASAGRAGRQPGLRRRRHARGGAEGARTGRGRRGDRYCSSAMRASARCRCCRCSS